MKKIALTLLMSFLALSFLSSKEVEREKKHSFEKHSIKVENELIIKGVKSLKDDENGNFNLHEDEPIENATTFKFAIPFPIFEGFTFIPFLKDKVVIASKGAFKKNDLIFGLKGTYLPMDILDIKFGVHYVCRYKDEFKETGTSLGNGFNANLTIALNLPSIFLDTNFSYEFNGMFAKGKKANNKNSKYYSLKHGIGLDATFDFFNFIKEDFNSGLLFSNKTLLDFKWTKESDSAKAILFGKKMIENEFGLGLHFGVLSYMDFAFLTKISSKFGYDADKGEGAWEKDALKELLIALSLAFTFNKDMLSFGIEYNPELSSKRAKPKKDLESVKALEHAVKIVLGISL